MLALILGWLPIIGPVISGLVAAWSKKQDTDLAKLKVVTDADVENAKTSAQIIEATKDDIGLRIARDIVIWPVAIWTALLTYDTIIADTVYKAHMWHVASFDNTTAPYLPYAVLMFLLGNIGINSWNKR